MTDPERYLEAELDRMRAERDDALCLLDEAVRLLRENVCAILIADYAFCEEDEREVRAFLDLVEKKR